MASTNPPRGSEGTPITWRSTLSFQTLIQKYMELQSSVVSQVRNVASQISAATPGKFLLLQFSMAQVTQIGDSISNLISQVNSMIKNAVGNMRG